MAKLIVINKTKGPIRINKVGRAPLVIKPGEQTVDASVLGSCREELLGWQRRQVLEIKALEEEEKQDARAKEEAVKPEAEETSATEESNKDEGKGESEKERKPKRKPKRRS